MLIFDFPFPIKIKMTSSLHSLRPSLENEHDFLFKILLIGDSGVGKTCLLLKYTDDVFQASHISTIGVDFRIKTMRLQDSKVAKLQMWDTAGQERFRTITSSYYRGAHGVIIVFDVGERRSFDNLVMWMGEVERYAKPGVPMILVGNKTDLVERREVEEAEAKAFADSRGLSYVEVSAKSDSESVLASQVFHLMVKEIRGSVSLGLSSDSGWALTKVDQKDPPPIKVDDTTPVPSRRGDCCSS